jgi:hypothetical protein
VLPASQDILPISRTISEPHGQRHLALTDPHSARISHYRVLRDS